jgi:hypothetical protein
MYIGSTPLQQIRGPLSHSLRLLAGKIVLGAALLPVSSVFLTVLHMGEAFQQCALLGFVALHVDHWYLCAWTYAGISNLAGKSRKL